MSHTIAPKHQKIVVQEIEGWQSEGLIDHDLALALIGRYANSAKTANISGALTLIGSVLVGLGALLFVGANWQQISVGVKLLLIIFATTAAHFFGWQFRFEPGNRPKLGNSLLVLGSLFFGAGIWLIAQMFNFDLTWSTGLMLWAIGSLASTLATRSIPLGCLTALLCGFLSVTKCDPTLHDTAYYVPLLYVTGSFFLSVYLANSLRSRAIAWITLILTGFSMVLWSGCNQAMLLWGLATFAGYLWHKARRPLFASPFLYVSVISLLGSLLFQTTDAHRITSDVNAARLGGTFFIAVSALMIVIWKVEKYRHEAVVALMLAFAGCLSYGYAEGAGRILSNVLLLSTIVGLVYTGLNRIQSAGLVNVALVFFVLDVIARYFDFFYSMMNRSLFFVLGGIILMVVGSLAETGRRKMIAGLDGDCGDTSLQNAY